MPFSEKYSFVGLNTDDEPTLVESGDYRMLVNGRVGKTAEEHRKAIENIKGNLELDYSELDEFEQNNFGTLVDFIAGYAYDPVENAYFILTAGEFTTSGHGLFKVLGDKVVAGNLFYSGSGVMIPNDRRVYSMVYVNGEVIWTTGQGEIMSVWFDRYENGDYLLLEPEDFYLMKRGPRHAPTADIISGSTSDSILIGRRHFQFSYRYVYWGNRASVLSPATKNMIMPLVGYEDKIWRVDIPDAMNSAESIPKTIEKIEYFARENNTGFWFYIGERVKEEVFTGFTWVDFANDINGFTLTADEGVKPFDYIPREVKALEFMRNRLFIANYKSGRDLSDIKAPSVEVIRFSSGFDTSFKLNSAYQIGINLYDDLGRFSGTIRSASFRTQRMPMLGDTYGNYIQWTLDPTTVFPSWARTYQIVLSPNLTMDFWVQNAYTDMFYHAVDEDDNEIWGKQWGKQDNNDPITWQHLMIDISSLTENELGYTHNETDRILFIFGLQYIDREILFQQGKFVAVRGFDVTGIKGVLAQGQTERFEIYSPAKQNAEELYYEVGESFDIVSGIPSVTTGIIASYDCYLNANRSYTPYDTAGYSNTDPSVNKLQASGFGLVADAMNRFDEEFELWNTDKGRVSVPWEPPGETESDVTVKYSNEQIPDSRINNLHQFELLNRYDKIGEERSPIVKLTRANNMLIANHLRSTTALYIQMGILRTVEGSEFLAKSTGVIQDDRELIGSYGCIPETVRESNGRMWWLAPDQGLVIRYTVNGTQPISDGNYKIERFIKDLAQKYSAANNQWTDRILLPHAGFDPEYKEYYLTFPETTDQPDLLTMLFSEETQRWIGRHQYEKEDQGPDLFMSTKDKFYSGLAGKLYIHNSNPVYNNFYGVQYNRKLLFIANPGPTLSKVWNNLWIHKKDLTQNGIDPVVTMYNKYGQQTELSLDRFIYDEGVWKAPVMFDMLSPNFASQSEALWNGDRMRSEWLMIEIESDRTDIDPLYLVTVLFKKSELTL